MAFDLMRPLLDWWSGVGGDFRFLLVLPFVVAAVGWLVDGRRPGPHD